MLARLALQTDEDAVVALARMQVEETLPHLDFDEGITRNTFRDSIQYAHPTIFVAEENREVVGYLMALMHGYAMAAGVYVAQEVLYVRPDKRGTRAAVKLIDIFVQWGETVGAKEISFGISNKFQPERTARLFQLRTGAEQVGIYLKRVTKHG